MATQLAFELLELTIADLHQMPQASRHLEDIGWARHGTDGGAHREGPGGTG